MARRLVFSFLDTGLLYRAATLAAIGASDERAVAAAVGRALIMVTARPGGSATITLDGQDVDGSLRSPEVDRSVSFVSAIPEVREQLAAEQQRFAETGDVVMVGRDIGTVVLPDAEIKIYLTASAETRARRRHEEHVAASNPSRYDEVLSELRKRDRIDSGRRTSPLRPAEDAHILHTDDMTLEKVVDRMAETRRGGAMTGQWIFPIANVLFKGSMGIFADYKVVGRENIPTDGPLIVVPNHLANIDPAIVASALNRPPLFMAKKELFSNPMMRFLLAGYGVHPLDRTGADLAALNWAKSQLVERGRAMILFPEGTRSRNQILQSGKPGVAHLASITDAPVVPFGLTGTSRLQGIVGVVRPTGRAKVEYRRAVQDCPG